MIFLGYPTAKIKEWIEEHTGPSVYNVIYANNAVVNNEMKVNSTDDMQNTDETTSK